MFDFKFFFQEIILDPWQDAENVEDFLYYCCPETECDFKNENKALIIEHAIENHPRSEQLFFVGHDVAKNVAEELIEIQYNSHSPSTGPTALAEALLSASNGKDEVDDDDNTAALEEYKSGNYSPMYITANDLDLGTIVITETEDESKRNREITRQDVRIVLYRVPNWRFRYFVSVSVPVPALGLL